MGDAAGIGPEIIMKTLAHNEIRDFCRPYVIGDAGRLRLASKILNESLQVIPIEAPPGEQDRYADGVLCVDLGLIPPELPFGAVSAEAGECAYRAVERAINFAQTGHADGICTAPISKAALHRAGHDFPGHTELLTMLVGAKESFLMMVSGPLRVIHVTMHMGLLDAIARIEPELVFRTITEGHKAMRGIGINAPRLAVCGINPHAGEGGLFGRGEEERFIMPAIARAQALGWDVTGPYPADSLFYKARTGAFDLVVAMYHDQGLGPIKVLGLNEAVNVTIGLPIIRTSVGHGTAFDIAGKGLADERGLMAALRQAALLAQNLPSLDTIPGE